MPNPMHLPLLILLAIVSLDDGWQRAVTEPRATPPGDEIAWRDDVDSQRGRDFWSRNRLPENTAADAQLVFRAYVGELTLFVDQRPIYTFRDAASHGRLTLHVVPLPPDSAGRRVYARVSDVDEDAPLLSAPLLASRAELPAAIQRASADPLRHDLGGVVAGAILIVIGLIAILVSQLLRRAETRALLFFGLMATLYGARIFANSWLPWGLGMRVRETQYAVAWLTYLINIPGWALARRLLGDGWKSSLRWQLYAFIAFAPIALATDLATGRPASLEAVNNILVIAGGLNIFFNVLHTRSWSSPELRVILAGSLLFLLLALINNLAGLGILPGDLDETPGFVTFVLALGYAATRNVLRGERARVALEGELATAREIQQSILPHAMPDVAGLRFHAHYDPASSVAGDLYDFLRVDHARVGALVADVSGHGVPAALIASMVKIAVSSQSRLAHDPAALLREVHLTLRGQMQRAFVTATYLYFDAEGRCVEVANAGHPPPLLYRGEEVRELGPRGVVLGRFDGTYTSESTTLQSGDRVFAYTDGVIEALNARGEAFGEERLHAAIRGGASADDVARAVRQWRDERSDVDDVTLVSIDVL